MKHFNFRKSLSLLLLNFVLILIINFLFTCWGPSAVSPINWLHLISKTMLMAIVFTLLLILFDQKKTED